MVKMAEVTPNALWPNATDCEVKQHGKSHGTVPILVIPITPVKLTIHRKQYSIGVVIFNGSPMPKNTIPIELEKRESELDVEDVFIPETGGQLYGFVVLFI
jgi:hypothetical protein